MESAVQDGGKDRQWKRATVFQVQRGRWKVMKFAHVILPHSSLFLENMANQSFILLTWNGWNSQEVRAVERRILLETLAKELPPGAVRFSSKLAKIEKAKNGETLLQLVDGTQLYAKVTLSPLWISFNTVSLTMLFERLKVLSDTITTFDNVLCVISGI